MKLKVSQKGVAIYLAIVVMFILLGIGLALSTILVSQMKVIRGMGDSVAALYAADTGIERELYEKNYPNDPPPGPYSGTLNDASYTVTILKGGNDTCPTTAYRCVRSVGVYKGVRRAIEVSF